MALPRADLKGCGLFTCEESNFQLNSWCGSTVGLVIDVQCK